MAEGLVDLGNTVSQHAAVSASSSCPLPTPPTPTCHKHKQFAPIFCSLWQVAVLFNNRITVQSSPPIETHSIAVINQMNDFTYSWLAHTLRRLRGIYLRFCAEQSKRRHCATRPPLTWNIIKTKTPNPMSPNVISQPTAYNTGPKQTQGFQKHTGSYIPGGPSSDTL